MANHQTEDVWDYPRPPRVESVDVEVRIEHRGIVVCDASRAHRVLETSHPPVYYIPPAFFVEGSVRPSLRPSSWCEWKGRAEYLDLVVGDVVVPGACWRYPEPTATFAAIAGAVAVYPSKVDACWVDGERVRPQAGDFYGGWITSWIAGGQRGFKGGPGTWGW